MLYKSTLPENTLHSSSAGEVFNHFMIATGLFFFVVSLFLPAFFTSGKDIYGGWVLAMGWMGVFFLQIAWYANPITLMALLLADKHPKRSLLLSLLALVIASEAFLFFEIPTGINNERIYIKELGLGFYLWYLAQICFLFSAIYRVAFLKK